MLQLSLLESTIATEIENDPNAVADRSPLYKIWTNLFALQAVVNQSQGGMERGRGRGLGKHCSSTARFLVLVAHGTTAAVRQNRTDPHNQRNALEESVSTRWKPKQLAKADAKKHLAHHTTGKQHRPENKNRQTAVSFEIYPSV